MQVNGDMRVTLKENDNFERAYNAKDVITPRKMLKTSNFNYKKIKKPIKTMWQATKDLMLMKQHKKDIHKYYEDFKTLNTVVPELNRRDHGSPFADRICRKRGENLMTLSPDEKSKRIKEGEEILLAMQLVMNANPDKYGSLTESYDQEFLSGENKYPTKITRCI